MAAAVEFEFEPKAEQTIPLSSVSAACKGGRYCWVDLDTSRDEAVAREVAAGVGLDRPIVEAIFGDPMPGRHDFRPECVHVTIGETHREKDGLRIVFVDFVLGERFLLTFHRGETEFLAAMRSQYRQDFHDFARSPGFLLFEFWDHLVASYRRTLRALETQVETMQQEMLADQVQQELFRRVQRLLTDLLAVRKHIVAAREALHELAIRRSVFVAETTRPYLENLATILERLAEDVTIERETLAEGLGLYLGLVGYRTNQIVNRLTIISTVFLPLTFVCGVYGMNFEHMPELKWHQGYALFWLVVLMIALLLIGLMKRWRWW